MSIDWKEQTSRDRRAETENINDTQLQKNMAITFMIKSSFQSNSNADCPVSGDQVGGRILTDM